MRTFSVELTNRNKEWGNTFLAERTAKGLVKIGIVAPVAVGGIVALSHLTHRDMGNATMMLGTSLAM
ncbi:hypothetical protein ACE02P_13380 [Shewanella bicestrii]